MLFRNVNCGVSSDPPYLCHCCSTGMETSNIAQAHHVAHRSHDELQLPISCGSVHHHCYFLNHCGLQEI